MFKKDPKDKWLWIIPLMGVVFGIAITGLMVFMQIGSKKSQKYCPVLDDTFSSGTLNPSVWTKEVQLGGFGYESSTP